MKKIITAVAVVGLMCAGSYSFANEIGKMANEMKGDMKHDMDSMKGDMKANMDAMKGKPGVMKDEVKGKLDDMKASKDAMKGNLKGAMGY